MADDAIVAPVPGDAPCGRNMQWDTEFVAVTDAFARILGEDGTNVVDGERISENFPSFDDVVADARRLSGRTKDMRILAIYLEATWRGRGLAAFAGALVDVVTVAETWPDPKSGLHPRADEEDGDLSERIAPLAMLLRRVPEIAASIGWGMHPNMAQQDETRQRLLSVFTHWTTRLEPAFGTELPAPREAWEVLRKIVGDAPVPERESEEDMPASAPGASHGASMDAWDALERAMSLMVVQNRHSPAVPMLRLLLGWREMDIVEISQRMRNAGISMEQLFDSIKTQVEDNH